MNMSSLFGFGIIDVDKVRETVTNARNQAIGDAVGESVKTFLSESVKKRLQQFQGKVS